MSLVACMTAVEATNGRKGNKGGGAMADNSRSSISGSMDPAAGSSWSQLSRAPNTLPVKGALVQQVTRLTYALEVNDACALVIYEGAAWESDFSDSGVRWLKSFRYTTHIYYIIHPMGK